jgi:hypothetical protein
MSRFRASSALVSTLARAALVLALTGAPALADGTTPKVKVPYDWTQEFPDTDWNRVAIDPADVLSGGPTRDGIPAIDAPVFRRAGDIRPGQIRDREPVIGVTLNGETRAYPLSVMIWHEVVNDTLGGEPVAITYSPLCNLAKVLDRKGPDAPVVFGVTGRLHHSCQILFDRETESWWDQVTGTAIAGQRMGETLAEFPARLESFGAFKERAGADAQVLVPADPSKRLYGTNPYWGYDRSAAPMFYKGALPEGIAPLARVVYVENEGETRAWSLDYLKGKERLEAGDLVITYVTGQVSALDAPDLATSRPVGGVLVQRRGTDGALEDVPHGVVFAFAFHAFFPKAAIVTE